MATIANLKSKLVLDIGEFSSAADRAVGKGKSMSQMLGRELEKAAKRYATTFKNSVLGAFGVTSISNILGDIGSKLRDLDYSNVTGLAEAFNRAGISIDGVIKQIPLLGDLYNFGEGVGMALNIGGVQDEAREAMRAEKRNAAIREGMEIAAKEQQRHLAALASEQDRYQDILIKLARQESLTKAITEEERKQLQQKYELQDLIESVMGKTPENVTDSELLERAARVETIKKYYEDVRKAEEERLANQEFWTQELEKGQEIMDEIEEAWDYIAELGELTAEAQAEAAAQAEKRAKANADEAMAAARRALEFSNVETIGTAIGGVKIGGMTSNSIERMMPTQEAIKSYSAQIARNTERLAAAGAP